jgi:hypothetical protein
MLSELYSETFWLFDKNQLLTGSVERAIYVVKTLKNGNFYSNGCHGLRNRK